MYGKRAMYISCTLNLSVALQQLLSTWLTAPVQVAFTSGRSSLGNSVGLLVILLADVGDRAHQHSQDKAAHPREEELGRVDTPVQEVAAKQMHDVSLNIKLPQSCCLPEMHGDFDFVLFPRKQETSHFNVVPTVTLQLAISISEMLRPVNGMEYLPTTGLVLVNWGRAAFSWKES